MQTNTLSVAVLCHWKNKFEGPASWPFQHQQAGHFRTSKLANSGYHFKISIGDNHFHHLIPGTGSQSHSWPAVVLPLVVAKEGCVSRPSSLSGKGQACTTHRCRPQMHTGLPWATRICRRSPTPQLIDDIVSQVDLDKNQSSLCT